MMIVNPKAFKLDHATHFDLWELLERVETSALADMKLYHKHPDWFVRDHLRETVDYDPKIGPRMILEARRKIHEGETAEDYINDHLQKLRPDSKRYKQALKLMQDYFADATKLLELRTPDEKILVRPDELSHYLVELPSKAESLLDFKDVVPSTSLRNCERFTGAATTPTTPFDTWQDFVKASSWQSLSLGQVS